MYNFNTTVAVYISEWNGDFWISNVQSRAVTARWHDNQWTDVFTEWPHHSLINDWFDFQWKGHFCSKLKRPCLLPQFSCKIQPVTTSSTGCTAIHVLFAPVNSVAYATRRFAVALTSSNKTNDHHKVEWSECLITNQKAAGSIPGTSTILKVN